MPSEESTSSISQHTTELPPVNGNGSSGATNVIVVPDNVPEDEEELSYGPIPVAKLEVCLLNIFFIPSFFLFFIFLILLLYK